MPTRKPLAPQITIGDKIITIGPADWGPFSDFVEAVAKADLPLPKLDTSDLKESIAAIQAGIKKNASLDLGDLAGVLFAFLNTNLATVCAWIGKQRSVLSPLLAATTNLTPEDAASLTAGQILRIARASFRELIEDGVFAEAGAFFGELVGLRPATIALPTNDKTESAPPRSTEASAAA